jgi:hypothetical protein
MRWFLHGESIACSTSSSRGSFQQFHFKTNGWFQQPALTAPTNLVTAMMKPSVSDSIFQSHQLTFKRGLPGRWRSFSRGSNSNNNTNNTGRRIARFDYTVSNAATTYCADKFEDASTNYKNDNVPLYCNHPRMLRHVQPNDPSRDLIRREYLHKMLMVTAINHALSIHQRRYLSSNDHPTTEKDTNTSTSSSTTETPSISGLDLSSNSQPNPSATDQSSNTTSDQSSSERRTIQYPSFIQVPKYSQDAEQAFWSLQQAQKERARAKTAANVRRALYGNLIICVAKFGAWLSSGSSSMMSEFVYVYFYFWEELLGMYKTQANC